MLLDWPCKFIDSECCGNLFKVLGKSLSWAGLDFIFAWDRLMMAIICRYLILNKLPDFVIWIGMFLFVLSGLCIVCRDIKNRPGTMGNRSKLRR